MLPAGDEYMMDCTVQKRRTAKLFAPLAAVLWLAGCAGDPVTLDAGVRSPGNEQAYVMPQPGSFAITGIVEQRHGNAVTQQIFLSTDSTVDGSNMVEVTAFGTRNPHRHGENKISFKPLTESQIARQMRAALPTVRMKKSDFFVQNEYGSFGYAMGRPASNELCMYAWQQIRSQGTGNLFAQRGALQIGVRLCKIGATESDLLSFMYGYSITAAVDVPGWNPYGHPPATPERLGKTGAPMYPTGDATVLPKVAPAAPAPAKASTRKRTRKSSASRPAQKVSRPTPSVIVPSPNIGSIPVPAANAASDPAVIVPSPTCVRPGSAEQVPCP